MTSFMVYVINGDFNVLLSGEPNNWESGNEDCVLIESDGHQWRFGAETSWKDYPCCRPVSASDVLCQIGY